MFLKLLPDRLVLSNDANDTALVDTVFNYSIKNNSKAKNSLEVSQNLSAITDTIMVIRNHKENPLPDGYVQHLTSTYQTTSVEAYNRFFAKLEDNVTYSQCNHKVTTSPSIQNCQIVSSSFATHASKNCP